MIALLDVNVLVALAWPNHVHHGSATAWFRANEAAGWATCPVSESGFVRVSANRHAIATATTVGGAIELLRRFRSRPSHRFWSDDISIADASEIAVEAIAGYRQVTDAHLLALAVRREGVLVTFDQHLAALGPADRIEVLRG